MIVESTPAFDLISLLTNIQNLIYLSKKTNKQVITTHSEAALCHSAHCFTLEKKSICLVCAMLHNYTLVIMICSPNK